MEPENQDLLARLATDVAGNYEHVVMLYWKPLRTFIIRRTIPVQEAEDLEQEIFLRAFLALKRYPTQQIQELKLRSWLYTIAWNACSNYLTRSKQPALISIKGEEDPVMELEDLQSEQPEIYLELREQREELEAQVAILPARYRDVVSLYYFEGFSQQEIASILNIRVGTVKVNVHRGLKLLQKLLATNRVR